MVQASKIAIKSTAEALAGRLRANSLGAPLRVYSKNKVEGTETGGWDVKIASLGPNRPEITLWYDKWLDGKALTFWLGFWGTINVVREFVEALPANLFLSDEFHDEHWMESNKVTHLKPEAHRLISSYSPVREFYKSCDCACMGIYGSANRPFDIAAGEKFIFGVLNRLPDFNGNRRHSDIASTSSSAWPFERGRVYKRSHLHSLFGGQRQGGIITPSTHPLVMLVTGEEGGQHGYSDKLRSDGVFEYFGEGQRGDMLLKRGNLAVAEHSKDGKSLLLFKKIDRSGNLRFEGEWICEDLEQREATDRNGNVRTAIVFLLRPLESVSLADGGSSELETSNKPLSELRELALRAANSPQISSKTTRTIYQRSDDVRRYVLARADGRCEGCEKPAPFQRANGAPYLEPHHIRRVSDGGPDHPRHVIALCPNCHRRVHAGADGAMFNASLDNKMGSLEAEVS